VPVKRKRSPVKRGKRRGATPSSDLWRPLTLVVPQVVAKVTMSILPVGAPPEDDPTFPAFHMQTGRAILTNLLSGSFVVPIWIGWGTGAGSTTVTNTDLFAPATEGRVLGVATQQTTNTLNDTIQIAGTVTCQGAQKTISNAGVFDGPGSGSPPVGNNIYLKGDFQGQNNQVPVGSGIQFTFLCQYV
jgi:hypothetical protein